MTGRKKTPKNERESDVSAYKESSDTQKAAPVKKPKPKAAANKRATARPPIASPGRGEITEPIPFDGMSGTRVSTVQEQPPHPRPALHPGVTNDGDGAAVAHQVAVNAATAQSAHIAAIAASQTGRPVEAVGLSALGGFSAHGEVVNPSSRLLEAMLRPTWQQEKADFLHVMREGKNLYDELHAIFGAKRDRAVDRDDFLAQVGTNRDLMASTVEVMQTELAQETPDARRVRLGGNVFAVLREGARAMGKFFAEGLFRELGRDVGARVPALLVQIQEKMHHLHQIVSGWLN